MTRAHLTAAIAAVTLGTVAGILHQSVGAQQRAEKHNMQLVGYSDLQARSAYQPVIHKQGDRWIAYVGHHGGTQPNPLTGKPETTARRLSTSPIRSGRKYLAHIPGEPGQGEAGGAQMVRVCDGSELPRADKSKVYLLRTFGSIGARNLGRDRSGEAGARDGRGQRPSADTHKNWWECDTGIAYLVSGDPDWRTRRMTKIYDLSDPANPVFIRDFGLPGQQPGSTGPGADRAAWADFARPERQPRATSATAPARAASCRSSIGRSC